MGLLLVPDDIYNDYWVRWDESTRKWILSTDQGTHWRHLIERPQIDYVTGNGITDPGDGGPGKGVLFFDGSHWYAYEGEGTAQRLLSTGTQTIRETKGGILWNPNGIIATTTVNVWYAPYACTVIEIRGCRTSGASCSVNARKNGTLNHLATDLVIPAAGGWYKNQTPVQNTSYNEGDRMEIMLTVVTGNPTDVGIEVVVERTI